MELELQRPQKGFILQRKKKGYLAGKKTQQASLVQGCVEWASVWFWGAGMVGIDSTTPQIGLFHVNNVRFDPGLSNLTPFPVLRSGFLNPLDLPWCLASFLPPNKKETQAPHLWLPDPGDFPCGTSTLPCPGTQSQFGAVPAATSLREFGPSSGLSVTFWEGWRWGEAAHLLPQKNPNPLLRDFPKWKV